MNPPPLPPRLPDRSTFAERHAIALKVLFVAMLVLLLMIPLKMADETRMERGARYQEAVAAITQSWGKSQRLIGPVLVVPYSCKIESEESLIGANGRPYREKVVRTQTFDAFFLPEQLQVNGTLAPSERRRGIYTTQVFEAKLRLSGRFAAPDLSFTSASGVEPHWDRARVCFAISDLRGTREALALKWNESDLPLQPGAGIEGFGTGLHAPLKLAAPGTAAEFTLELTLNGSESFTVVPLGRQTDVHLTSPWRDPGFNGSFLPVRREVGAAGFDATWQVSYYGRDFPQQWTDLRVATAPVASKIEGSAFGVTLVQTVTAYRTVERAIKYGALFLALVFATFFLFEVVSGVRLNALNYLLVGAALCLFYLGLLSLSEFVGFTLAYGVAAALSLLLVGCYSRRVLRSGGRALGLSGMLGGVYGYLYFVLQMEDFALLAGTGALFTLLAAVMYATRRIEENAPAPASDGNPGTGGAAN